MTAVWTNESVRELRRMLEIGMTFTDIGAALKLSKSAVVGKAFRLGIRTGHRASKTVARSHKCDYGKHRRDGWSDGIRSSTAPITLAKLKWMDRN